MLCYCVCRSTATSLQLTYSPTPVTTAFGNAVTVLSAVGTRTYTNRFGESFSTALSLAPLQVLAASNLLYINNTQPVDANGLTWQLATPVQLPGVGPNPLVSQINVHNVDGIIVEGASTRVDGASQSFQSNIPGFINVTVGASNANALAASYVTCTAPITFTNFLRPVIEPNVNNGFYNFSYSYFVSDGLTYAVTGNLTVSTSSPFATTKDMLGSQYQTVINVVGTRFYRHLPSGQTLTSTVSGLSLAENANADQRWYPYALLSAAPGVYQPFTAPYVDNDGLEFNVNPPVPVNGVAPGVGALYTATSVFMSTPEPNAALAEGMFFNQPDVSLQQQVLLQAVVREAGAG